MKYIYLSILSLLAAYILILIFIYFNQRNLLYHPAENNYLNDKIEFNYEEVWIQTEKDIKLKSWLIKKDLKKYKTLIFFHGNAGNLLNRVHKLNELSKLDINILIISWRGFSGNPGKPTEKNLYIDANMSIKWLNDLGISNNQIILYGESLGTGVAVELGQANTFNSIILESPFTSIAKAAKIYYPYLPINLLLKDRYDSIKKIDKISRPILIMHGLKDNIVPYEMGVKLFQKANQPKYSYFPKDDNHMMNFNKELLDTIRVFINQN
ncbi:alpha/beta hydrolase [Candidatus Pelagibacter bacterium]|nr:alpha/beta hydrolase [Candidatus Pelagibacter bacterium]MDA9625023.1 alpha/beta hydrolase [Candidatus Pelagibacter bacterium]